MTLTQEQIAQVATIVTGWQWKVVDASHVNPFANVDDKAIVHDGMFWNADFGSPGGRSQALAIVEWLANRINRPPRANYPDSTLYEMVALDILKAVHNKDTTALQALVLELHK